MGYIYAKLKQKKKAFIAYEKALKYDKEDISTWLEYSNSLEDQHPEKALRSYQKALLLIKQQKSYIIYPEIYINIGVLYQNAGKLD